MFIPYFFLLLLLSLFACFWLLETEDHFIAPTSFKYSVLQPQPLECWNCRLNFFLLYLVYYLFFIILFIVLDDSGQARGQRKCICKKKFSECCLETLPHPLQYILTSCKQFSSWTLHLTLCFQRWRFSKKLDPCPKFIMDLCLLRLVFIHQLCLAMRDILYLVHRYRVTEVMNISELVANVTLASLLSQG